MMPSHKNKVSSGKIFLRFICISFLVHLVYILFFEVEIEKKLSKKYSYQLIFIGSYLKEVDVRNTVLSERVLPKIQGLDLIIDEITKPYSNPVFINPAIFKHSISKIKKLEIRDLSSSIPGLKIDEFPASAPELLSSKNLSLEGDITDRELLYRPEFLRRKSSVNFSDLSIFKFKVCVLPDGRVFSVENLTSTGDPILDRYLASNVQNWIFTPLPQIENVRCMWGVLKINLNN